LQKFSALKKNLLFFLGIFILLKPLIPFLEYALNYDYIVKELCEQKDAEENTCNGTCHLSKRIQETSDDLPSHKSQEKKVEQAEILFIEETSFPFQVFVPENTLIENLMKNLVFKSVALDIPDPPPNVV